MLPKRFNTRTKLADPTPEEVPGETQQETVEDHYNYDDEPDEDKDKDSDEDDDDDKSKSKSSQDDSLKDKVHMMSMDEGYDDMADDNNFNLNMDNIPGAPFLDEDMVEAMDD